MFLFVYGSLLRGLHNHCCLRTAHIDGAKFVKEDTIVGRLFSNGAYPFVVLNPTLSTLNHGNNLVLGEVYEIQSIENCDRLESYKADRPESENLFNRRSVLTTSGIEVYVYEGGHRFLNFLSAFKEVPNNDWKKYFDMTKLEQSLGISDSWPEIEDLLSDEDDPDNNHSKYIIHKIFRNQTLPAKKIDELFQRNVTKAQLIQCIILLVNTVDELI